MATPVLLGCMHSVEHTGCVARPSQVSSLISPKMERIISISCNHTCHKAAQRWSFGATDLTHCSLVSIDQVRKKHPGEVSYYVETQYLYNLFLSIFQEKTKHVAVFYSYGKGQAFFIWPYLIWSSVLFFIQGFSDILIFQWGLEGKLLFGLLGKNSISWLVVTPSMLVNPFQGDHEKARTLRESAPGRKREQDSYTVQYRPNHSTDGLEVVCQETSQRGQWYNMAPVAKSTTQQYLNITCIKCKGLPKALQLPWCGNCWQTLTS